MKQLRSNAKITRFVEEMKKKIVFLPYHMRNTHAEIKSLHNGEIKVYRRQQNQMFSRYNVEEKCAWARGYVWRYRDVKTINFASISLY